MSYCDAIAGYPNSKANPHNSNNGTHASDCAHDCSQMKYYCRVLQQDKGPIQKRSFTTASLPLQDTPAAKLTYTAAITVPTPLTALMSAVPQDSPKGSANGAATHTFHFKQEVPIPSYLLALAVGELESRQIGPRSKVRQAGAQRFTSAARQRFEESNVTVAQAVHNSRSPVHSSLCT